MIWENTQASQQAGPARMQLVVWDFLKMLVAAILCGLAVSITAAGITLLLTGGAEARPLQKAPVMAAAQTIAHIIDRDDAETDDLSPTPGVLLLGDGCESISLAAIERDWRVRIEGNLIDVRVMQTFQLPAEAVEVATFHARLMKGARMQSLAAQSSTQDWAGHVISADEYDRLTPAQYLKLSRHQLLTSHSPRGVVMTSPFLGLKSGDLITIEYAYEMTLDSADGPATFMLPLEAADEYAANSLPMVDRGGALSYNRTNTGPTRGAVWVNWIGHKPSRVTGLPVEADLDVSMSRVDGFSWAIREIQPGARFQIAWTL